MKSFIITRSYHNFTPRLFRVSEKMIHPSINFLQKVDHFSWLCSSKRMILFVVLQPPKYFQIFDKIQKLYGSKYSLRQIFFFGKKSISKRVTSVAFSYKLLEAVEQSTRLFNFQNSISQNDQPKVGASQAQISSFL